LQQKQKLMKRDGVQLIHDEVVSLTHSNSTDVWISTAYALLDLHRLARKVKMTLSVKWRRSTWFARVYEEQAFEEIYQHFLQGFHRDQVSIVYGNAVFKSFGELKRERRETWAVRALLSWSSDYSLCLIVSASLRVSVVLSILRQATVRSRTRSSKRSSSAEGSI